MYFPNPRLRFISLFFKKEKRKRETGGDKRGKRGEKFINLCVSMDMAQLGQNVPAKAGGASAGAWQQNPAICRKVNELINDLRSDLVLAIRIDEFVRWLNNSIKNDVEEGRGEATTATADDVKECIRYNTTVKVVKTKDAEVLWLWESFYYYELVEKVSDAARRYRVMLADPENPDVYDGDDCGMLDCGKGDDDMQMKYFEE